MVLETNNQELLLSLPASSNYPVWHSSSVFWIVYPGGSCESWIRGGKKDAG